MDKAEGSNRAQTEVVLFADWDETISAHDTLALIAPPDGQHPGIPFAQYGQAYLKDLDEHEAHWRAARTAPSRSPTKYLEEQLAFLASLDAVELASQKRIEEGGLFRGCDPEGIEERAAMHVEHRQGWPEFARRWLCEGSGDTVGGRPLHTKPIEMHIISVGWSARFIAAGLRQTCVPASICANEVEISAETGQGTGRLTKSRDAAVVDHVANARRDKKNSLLRDEPSAHLMTGRAGIRVAQHKTREIRRILAARHVGASASETAPPPITVYAGDSPTDLDALLSVDIGLILADKKSLRDVLRDLFQTESTKSASLATEAHPIGRFFESVDEALPSVKPHIADLKRQRACSSTLSQRARTATEHRAFLVHVQDWHQAHRIFDVVCSS